MADAAVAPAEGQEAGRGGGIISQLMRMFMMWQFMNMLKNSGFLGGAPASKAPAMAHVHPIFKGSDHVNFHVYISPNESSDFIASRQVPPIWEGYDIPLQNFPAMKANVSVEIPESVQRNGTLYAHWLFWRTGVELEEAARSGADMFGKVYPLNSYRQRRKPKEYVSLLEAKSGDIARLKEQHAEVAKAPVEVVSYWRPNMTVQVIDLFTPYLPSQQVPAALKHIQTQDLEQGADQKKQYYYPVVWHNDFWVLGNHLILLNESTPSLPLALELSPLSFWKFQAYTQMDESFKMQNQMAMQSDGERDEFKRILLETNPWYLALTMGVSLLHTVFDMLAFKNDIGFWSKNKSMEGLSARTIIIQAGCQLVVFLYLLDNRDDTSFMILISQGLSLLIELWKITKAMQVSIVRSPPGSLLPFRLLMEDRASYVSSDTKKYDEEAVRYLSYALYPLVIGYSIYSLYFSKHKSWYSWVVSSLMGAVTTFGFILMCPQLYLNYKLKSVAHLPWRQMTYKFLNTIIDDLFAFIVKMPLLQRIAVFRDDVVFLIFIYQKRIYRVDKARANEFGWAEEEAAAAAAAAALAAGEGAEGAAGESSAPPALTAGGESKERVRERKGKEGKEGKEGKGKKGKGEEKEAKEAEGDVKKDK